MSKDLEKEYSEMIRSDMPDLWDRIRTSLPEKEVKTEVKTFRRRRYLGIAAACVCASILIPVITLTQHASKENAAMSSAAAETAAVPEMKTAEAVTYNAAAGAVEDAAEEKKGAAETNAGKASASDFDAEIYEDQEEAYAEEAPAASAETFSEAAVPYAASEVNAAAAAPSEETATEMDLGSMEVDEPENMAAAEPAEEAMSEAGTVLQEISLTIREISDGEEFRIRAAVSEDSQGLLSGSEILLIMDDETPEGLPDFREGENYRFDLEQYPGDSPDTYRIRAVKH